ncbi:MAG: hypothetical protein ABIF06_02085 [bacterium]
MIIFQLVVHSTGESPVTKKMSLGMANMCRLRTRHGVLTDRLLCKGANNRIYDHEIVSFLEALEDVVVPAGDIQAPSVQEMENFWNEEMARRRSLIVL